MVTPYTGAFLPAAADVTDILVQKQCVLDGSDHLEIAYDPIAVTDVLNALDPAHSRAIACQPVSRSPGPYSDGLTALIGGSPLRGTAALTFLASAIYAVPSSGRKPRERRPSMYAFIPPPAQAARLRHLGGTLELVDLLPPEH